MPPYFYNDVPPKATKQGLTRSGPRVKVTKEARAQATARQRERAQAYSKDLDHAWTTLEGTVENLAKDHHKSVVAVQADLALGRAQVTRPHVEKTSAWNAFMWKKAQERKEAGKGVFR